MSKSPSATSPAEVIVAGHICLDVIPHFFPTTDGQAPDLSPGKLLVVGPALRTTGGAVSNTGLALHRLNVPTTLMGKVGDDLFGQEIRRIVAEHAPALAEGMTVVPGETSSYSIVISPPNTDRLFLHCPGANDTFTADDVDDEAIGHARLLHFGYPPAMRCMYQQGGAEAARLFQKVKARGLTTSLDVVYPDPHSEAGQIDWARWLERVLPHVDVFAPNIEELLFMLDRDRHDRLADDPAVVTDEVLRELTDRLLAMGVAIAAIKLGDRGLYLRTTGDADRWRASGRCVDGDATHWLGRELFTPCLEAKVVGTTGAGDTTVAGLLAALWRGAGPAEALLAGVAVGACSVEQAGAVDGVPAWDKVMQRLQNGWPRQAVRLTLNGWRCDEAAGVHVGPADASTQVSI